MTNKRVQNIISPRVLPAMPHRVLQKTVSRIHLEALETILSKVPKIFRNS